MKDDEVKFGFLRLKNLIIQYKYNKNILNYDNNIILLMNHYVKNLKLIDSIYTVSDIESVKRGNTSYPDNLYINELINRLSFFSVTLGFIDGKINSIKTLIEKENIYYTKKDLEYFSNLLNFYISIREKLCEQFEYNDSNKNFNRIYYILTNESCYNILYNLFNTNINVDNLNIVNSYLIGYSNYDKYDIVDIYNEFLNLYSELNIFKNKNRDKFNNYKIKKLKR